jgi:hypothetical protein
MESSSCLGKSALEVEPENLTGFITKIPELHVGIETSAASHSDYYHICNIEMYMIG